MCVYVSGKKKNEASVSDTVSKWHPNQIMQFQSQKASQKEKPKKLGFKKV